MVIRFNIGCSDTCANSVTETIGGSSDAKIDFNGVAAHALISQDTTQCKIGYGDGSDACSEEDPEELEATSEESEEIKESEQADPEVVSRIGE